MEDFTGKRIGNHGIKSFTSYFLLDGNRLSGMTTVGYWGFLFSLWREGKNLRLGSYHLAHVSDVL